MRTKTLALSMLLAAGAARGDGAWLREVFDARGRLTNVAPQQNTAVAMRGEVVSIVPFLRGDEAMLYVNVRYRFANPGAAATLLVGFPELRGDVTTVESDRAGERSQERTPHATIDRFAADVAGRPLDVRVAPGRGDYARWFTFDVPFGAGETALRNRYVASPGCPATSSHEDASFRCLAEYILHTGSTWAGPIGEGDVNLWDGRPVNLRHFTDLTPGRGDDVSVPLSITVPPSPGRPLFAWLYGNGRQLETVAPRVERASLVQESSAAPDAALPHLGAAVLDGDPDTAWVDAGPRGAAGEWVQVPTHRLGRLRALTLTQPAGGARIRAAWLTCLDLDGNAPTLTEVARAALTFEDRAGAQRALLPQGAGPCHAARLTVEALHGPPDGHVRVAELAFTD